MIYINIFPLSTTLTYLIVGTHRYFLAPILQHTSNVANLLKIACVTEAGFTHLPTGT